MKRFGLLIASSNGKGLPHVDWVDNSLNLVLSMLTKSPGWAWDRLKILRNQDLQMLSQPETSSLIESWLKAREDDQLSFVYYVGHGRMVPEGQRQVLHLAFPSGDIPAKVAVDAAALSKAAKVFLALDCCFAEGAWDTSVLSFVEWVKNLFPREQASSLHNMNRALYAACARNQFAFPAVNARGERVGEFTDALVKGCQDGGGRELRAAPSGTVTAEGLAEYLRTMQPRPSGTEFGPSLVYGGFEIKSTREWREHKGAENPSRALRGTMLPENRTLNATPSWVAYDPQQPNREINTSHVAASAYAMAVGYKQGNVEYIQFGRPFENQYPRDDPTCTFSIPTIVPDDYGVKLSPDARHMAVRVRNNAGARTPTSLCLYTREADKCEYKPRQIDENIWADQFLIVSLQAPSQTSSEEVEVDSGSVQQPPKKEHTLLVTTEWQGATNARRAGQLNIRTAPQEGPLRLVAGSSVGLGGGIHHMRFRSQAATALLVAGDTNSHIFIWDLSLLQTVVADQSMEPIPLTPRLDVVPPPIPDEPRYQIRRVAMSSDGTLVAAGFADGTVFIWATSDGHQVAKLTMHRDLHKGPITALEFSSTKRWLASAANGSVYLTDLSKDHPNPQRWLSSNEFDGRVAIRSLAFSSSGDHQIVAAGASNGELFLTHDFDHPIVGSKQLPDRETRHEIYRLAILPCNMNMYRLVVVDKYRLESWYLNWEEP